MSKYLIIKNLVSKYENVVDNNFIKSFFYQYLPTNNQLIVSSALEQSVFGFGRVFSRRLHGILAFHPSNRAKLIDRSHLKRLDYILRESYNLMITDKLVYEIKANKQFYIDIRSYHGSRLIRGYPSRGQSTRTNGNTSQKLCIF